MQGLGEQLDSIQRSILHFVPELTLALGLLLAIVAGLLLKRDRTALLSFTIIVFLVTTLNILFHWKELSIENIFYGMLRIDTFSSYLKILLNISGILTCAMALTSQEERKHQSEFCMLLLTLVLGGHLLVMSNNLLMVFISLEIVSICSYVLAGYSFTKHGAEGSLKYFLFGSVASAVMLYGFSILYGLTGTLDFASTEFVQKLMANNSPLFLIAGLMALAGFLYKVAAAPMHPWAPDVYEGAPMPVIAFLSVAPKLAGLGVLTKFTLTINLFGQSVYDWQMIISVVAIVTLTVGNFSALWQKNPKRMMAYSSIAQTGFMLVGLASFLPEGIYFMLFYAGVYLLMNFAVFFCLQFFEKEELKLMENFSGKGKTYVVASVLLLMALISLTGLPPTGGFTAKIFVFSSLWESYQLSGKPILLGLLVFGLLNTVVSLFYYLKIPYYAFLKNGEFVEKRNILTFENLFSFILVLLLLALFFQPSLLMGWINKINFVL
ncbi:MAG: NADH-quinone oxidoreductase subunit N [Bacteroidota bacterium]